MKYTKINIAIIMIMSILFLSIVAKSEEITWNNICNPQTISNNITITCGNYVVSNIHFSAPVRGIKNSKGNIVPEYSVVPGISFNIKSTDNSIIAENNVILSQEGEYWTDIDQRVKVIAVGFQKPDSNVWIIESYNPTATLYVQSRQIPKISLSLSPDKTQYESGKDSNINVTLFIQNTDTFKFSSIKINHYHNNLTISTSTTSSQESIEYCCLDQGQNVSYTYNYNVPKLEVLTQYVVNATIQARDPLISDKYIKYNISTKFTVLPMNKQTNIVVMKYLPDRFYTSDNVTEIITVINRGQDSLYGVVITDTNNILYPINKSQKLEWYIPEIKSSEQKEIYYIVYPTISGEVKIPEAKVKYSYYGQNYQNFSNNLNVNIINNPYMKIRDSPIISVQTPIEKPESTSIVPITPPQVVETKIIQPIPTETLVVPIRPPSSTPKSPGFDIVFAIAGLLLVRRVVG